MPTKADDTFESELFAAGGIIPSSRRDSDRREALAELARRKIEALRLYSPQPFQRDFHACIAYERIIRGGNQSGKTTAAAVEMARIVTNSDPHGKYPKKGIAVVIGYDQDHIGKTIYPVLCKPGAFKMIRDGKRGNWRSWNPADPEDVAREHLAEPASPLIPRRFIGPKKVVWENAGEEVFSKMEFRTGWELWAYSSRAKLPQGFRADAVWIDEDLDDEEWLDEIQARVVAKKGRFFWSALPHSRNKGLVIMSKRALADERDAEGNPDVVEFRSRFSANPFISDAAKRKTVKAWQWSGSDIVRMRDEGEFVLDEFKVFPEFSMSLLGRSPFNAEHKEFKDGQLPREWCRYAVIDPGFVTGAVLFLAVTPAAFGDHVYLEDELYIPRCTADKLAQQMRLKMTGRSYRAFIIDDHGSRRTEASGKSIRQQYSEAMKRHRVHSEVTGYGFALGSDDVEARVMACHEWLSIREDGTTKLRVVEGRLPNFEMEIDQYMKKRQGKQTLQRPDDRALNHLMHCFQYAAAHKGLRYYKPDQNNVRGSRWKGYLDRKKARGRKGEAEYVNLGPGK